MSFPFEKLLNYDGNVYVLTCATMKRAVQLARVYQYYTSYEECLTIDQEDVTDPPLSLALQEVLLGSVQFQLD